MKRLPRKIAFGFLTPLGVYLVAEVASPAVLSLRMGRAASLSELAERRQAVIEERAPVECRGFEPPTPLHVG